MGVSVGIVLCHLMWEEPAHCGRQHSLGLGPGLYRKLELSIRGIYAFILSMLLTLDIDYLF